jgi:Cys-tRNA(Pro)/Cys-tRNA(Cys) deacylase
MNKTNAARLLDKLGVKYELIAYQIDESDLSAVSVATKLGQNIEQVFKTLVLRGDKIGIFVCVIPGGDELDLKLTAKASGNKSAVMVAMKELFPLTGYIRGGCSPLAMKKRYPVFINESCMQFDSIYVSAGLRGLQIKLSPNDLIRVTDGKVCSLIIDL